jgi:hypothetical protein
MTIDLFPDMDNLVGKYFEFRLLKGELFVAFLVLDVLCLVVHVEDKQTALPYAMIETTHRIRQKLTLILDP